jgi:hypothetical protein
MIRETLERATGRPMPAGELSAAAEAGPGWADELRGTILGLLLEERLRTRHGRCWIAERRAAEFLGEVWEAEPHDTAESMAASLGVGTIEPTPLLDGCRP